MTAQAVSTTRYLLDPSAYTSTDWFAREQRDIFTKRWAHVGSVDQLVAPGDYIATTIGTAPVVVVRGPDGEIRAFHNVCRHRGMVMLDGEGNCGSGIECFYHRWRWSLGGELERVPQRKEQFPTIDTSQWGLVPASVGVWEGLVFAHPDPQAADFDDVVAGITANVGSFRPGALRHAASRSFEANCNWKLFVENHVDVLHLWYLHAETLGDFDHTKFEFVNVGGDWFSYEPLREDRSGINRGTTPITHIDDRDRFGIGAHLMFPNTMMATSAEFVGTYVAVPLAPDRTRIDLRIFAEADADGEALVAAAASFIEEDIVACERVQAALSSPVFAVGPLAVEHERPITVLHQHILSALEGAA